MGVKPDVCMYAGAVRENYMGQGDAYHENVYVELKKGPNKRSKKRGKRFEYW